MYTLSTGLSVKEMTKKWKNPNDGWYIDIKTRNKWEFQKSRIKPFR